jgi:hypothetical protein
MPANQSRTINVTPKIFICYRRDDDPFSAARLLDGLRMRFDEANLFMDVDTLLGGQRFEEQLNKAVSVCDVFIAVIGSRWMELLEAKSANGERDYVKDEVAVALQRQMIVIPVRVGREGHLLPLPRAEELPTSIRDLVAYHAQDITYERFRVDIAELIKAITIASRMSLSKSGGTQLRWDTVRTASAITLSSRWFLMLLSILVASLILYGLSIVAPGGPKSIKSLRALGVHPAVFPA